MLRTCCHIGMIHYNKINFFTAKTFVKNRTVGKSAENRRKRFSQRLVQLFTLPHLAIGKVFPTDFANFEKNTLSYGSEPLGMSYTFPIVLSKTSGFFGWCSQNTSTTVRFPTVFEETAIML